MEKGSFVTISNLPYPMEGVVAFALKKKGKWERKEECSVCPKAGGEYAHKWDNVLCQEKGT